MASLLEDREQNYGMGPGGFLLELLPGFGRPLCRWVDTGVSSHACIAVFPERWLFVHGHFQKKPRSPSKLEGPRVWMQGCKLQVSLRRRIEAAKCTWTPGLNPGEGQRIFQQSASLALGRLRLLKSSGGSTARPSQSALARGMRHHTGASSAV